MQVTTTRRQITRASLPSTQQQQIVWACDLPCTPRALQAVCFTAKSVALALSLSLFSLLLQVTVKCGSTPHTHGHTHTGPHTQGHTHRAAVTYDLPAVMREASAASGMPALPPTCRRTCCSAREQGQSRERETLCVCLCVRESVCVCLCVCV